MLFKGKMDFQIVLQITIKLLGLDSNVFSFEDSECPVRSSIYTYRIQFVKGQEAVGDPLGAMKQPLMFQRLYP